MDGTQHQANEGEAWWAKTLRIVFFKVLIPLLVVLAIWPVYAKVFWTNNPFERAFANGELLIFAALLLFEAAIEGEHIQKSHWSFLAGRYSAFTLGFLLLVFFALVKFDIMWNEKTPEYTRMYFYACAGWLCALFSGLYSIFAFSYTTYRDAEEKLKSIRQ